MKYFGAGLGEMHKELGTMIRKADRLEDARRLFSELHGALHLSEVSGGEENELDRLTGDLEDPEYAVMVTSKDETIAWALWHIAREPFAYNWETIMMYRCAALPARAAYSITMHSATAGCLSYR